MNYFWVRIFDYKSDDELKEFADIDVWEARRGTLLDEYYLCGEDMTREQVKAEVKTLGKWNDQEITYQVGRYGPYVKCGKMMASAKKDGTVPTLDEAITLLQDKMRQK